MGFCLLVAAVFQKGMRGSTPDSEADRGAAAGGAEGKDKDKPTKKQKEKQKGKQNAAADADADAAAAATAATAAAKDGSAKAGKAPSAAAAAAAGGAAVAVPRTAQRFGVCAVAVAVLLACTARTWTRNKDWYSNPSLWRSTRAVCGGNPSNLLNYGITEWRAGHIDNAHEALVLSMQLEPENRYTENSVAPGFARTRLPMPRLPVVYTRSPGHVSRLAAALALTLACNARLLATHACSVASLAGSIMLGNVQDLAKWLSNRAVRAAHGTGKTAATLNDFELALSALQAYHELHPHKREIKTALANALVNVGVGVWGTGDAEFVRAGGMFAEALALDPDSLIASRNMRDWQRQSKDKAAKTG
jgi:hypothetical protein